MSASPARGQPADAAVPMEPGSLVPWTAMRSPPCQPDGRLGWCAESARMQQP